MDAWRGMLRTHQQLIAILGAELEARHGMTVSEYDVLRALTEAEQQRASMGDLADRVLLTPSGITRLVDRLVDRGYVVRETSRADARRQHAVLTPAGREAWTIAGRTHLAGIRRLFISQLAEDELISLGEIWRHLGTQVGATPAGFAANNGDLATE
jgi:DNA-binding MarR family transcriptional regulator